MEYVKLGNTGLDVSRLCLGCMTYGDPQRGTHEWTLNENESRPLIKQAVEAGINFFDTANAYSNGSSEEIVGKALNEFTQRDEVVIATKVFVPMRQGPNGGGLSRKVIMHEIDASLKRLGTDYIDLYQIHRFDPKTPIEETMEALHDVVKAGKARYIGASSMYAWQFATMQHTAQINGWTKFVSMQNQVSLLYREEEREMLPLCEAEGVGVMPWSPLARGRLARPWGEVTTRSKTDDFAQVLYSKTEDADRKVVEALSQLASDRNLPMAQIALAWLLHKSAVTSPIIGASKARQLDDAISSLNITLSEDEIKQLEAPYIPHEVVGFV